MQRVTINEAFKKVQTDLEKYVNTNPEINQYLFSKQYGVIFGRPPTEGSAVSRQLYFYPGTDNHKVNWYILDYPAEHESQKGEFKITKKAFKHMCKTIHQGALFNGKSHNEITLLRKILLAGVNQNSELAKNAEAIYTLNNQLNKLQKMESDTIESVETLVTTAKEVIALIDFLDQEIKHRYKFRKGSNKKNASSELRDILTSCRETLFQQYKSNPAFLAVYVREITREHSPGVNEVLQDEMTSSMSSKNKAIAIILSKLQAWGTEENKVEAELKFNALVEYIDCTLEEAKMEKSTTLIEEIHEEESRGKFMHVLKEIKERVEACHDILQRLQSADKEKNKDGDATSSSQSSVDTNLPGADNDTKIRPENILVPPHAPRGWFG